MGAPHTDHEHDEHDDHNDHGHEDPHEAPDADEATIRTPLWLPFVGLSLLLVIAMGTFMFISPGNWARGAATAGDGGGDDASAAPAN
ncbi:MAG: hypothetical protein Q8Q09_15835 [Deltaproteobacteria bacterium]|nr:hypothetical protein [Deltaproteobacteria bacterium]